LAKVLDAIDDRLARFIAKQRVFFVATAPTEGHVNLSPKGMDCFRVVGPNEVAYLDVTGSGAETIAHLRADGRITFMFMALDGGPMILRLYGQGRVVEPVHAEWDAWQGRFPAFTGTRSVIVAAIHRVATSCGFGVPVYRYERERPTLEEWAQKQGEEGLAAYRRETNGVSIDGLPTELLVE
jgi:hypothetical protein